MATTGAQLIAGAKELADLTGSDAVSDSQWYIWINDGVRELHGVVSTAFADTFYTEVSFTLTSSSNVYTLPSTFMRLRGLDYNPGLPSRQTVHRYNFGERNSPAGSPFAVSRNRRSYRVVSRTSLIVEPLENAPGNYKLMYVKRPIDVTAGVDLQDELEPWAEYPMLVAASKALIKEQSDPSDLTARLAMMRQDIESSATTDEGEPDSVTDVEAGRGWM